MGRRRMKNMGVNTMAENREFTYWEFESWMFDWELAAVVREQDD